MQTIRLETRIAAPAMRVFLLSLSVDLHKASTKQTGEEAIAGVTNGIMELHDVVTWRARHFGLSLKHTSQIVQYDPPRFFCDRMTEGMFRSFEHDHSFVDAEDASTLMIDVLRFSSPLSWLGAAVDRFVLRDYLTRFLIRRNQLVREVAEGSDWRRFLLADYHSIHL